MAAAGFSISMFVLLFLGRVFQTSYLVWPLAGVASRTCSPPDDAKAPEPAARRRAPGACLFAYTKRVAARRGARRMSSPGPPRPVRPANRQRKEWRRR